MSILAILACAGLCGGIFALVQAGLRGSTAYTEALARARRSPEVLDAFGGSIEPRFFVSGNIRLRGSDGDATIDIPIKGPSGGGSIHVEATRIGGEWRIDRLWVEKDDRRFELGGAGSDRDSYPEDPT